MSQNEELIASLQAAIKGISEKSSAQRAFEFDFRVENISHLQAAALMNIVISCVESIGGVIAGGFVRAGTEAQDGKEG
jgi:hypothetical protein